MRFNVLRELVKITGIFILEMTFSPVRGENSINSIPITSKTKDVISMRAEVNDVK